MRRLRAALLEVGYEPELFVDPRHPTFDNGRANVRARGAVSEGSWYKACQLVYDRDGTKSIACYACYLTRDRKAMRRCIEGDCQHPDGPRIPARDELCGPLLAAPRARG